MKYAATLIILLSIVFSFSCSKKDLPAPNTLNASNTAIYQQNNTTPPVLTAPCAAILQNNRITYTYSPSGTSMSFTPNTYSFYNNMVTIRCMANATNNEIRISIPEKTSFVGSLKYDVTTTAYTTSDAFLSHIFDSYYLYENYIGYEGDIYAEYTSTLITLSFCGVKVKDNYGSVHEVTGRVVIPNNF